MNAICACPADPVGPLTLKWAFAPDPIDPEPPWLTAESMNNATFSRSPAPIAVSTTVAAVTGIVFAPAVVANSRPPRFWFGATMVARTTPVESHR